MAEKKNSRMSLLIVCIILFFVLAGALMILIYTLPSAVPDDPADPETVTARTFFASATSSVAIDSSNKNVTTEAVLSGNVLCGFFFRVTTPLINGGTAEGAVGLDAYGTEKGVRILSRPENSADAEARAAVLKAAHAAMPDAAALAAEKGWTLGRREPVTSDSDTSDLTEPPITNPDTIPPDTDHEPVSRVDSKAPQNDVKIESTDTVFDTETLPPVTEPVTEPITEPITEPVTEPITEPVTEPITEPVTEPITEPITEPVTEPITEPTTEIDPPETEPMITTEEGEPA